MKKIYTVLAIAVALIVLAVTVNSKTEDTSPIEIGISVPLTGDAASLGEFLKNVSDMAVEKINKEGGIAGRKVSLIYEDDMCAPAKSVGAVQKLANVNNVKVIVISTCSGAVIPTVPIATQKNILMLSGVATSPNLTNSSPLFARTVPSDASQAVALAEYAKKAGFKRIAIVYENTDYTSSIKDSFVRTYESESNTTVVESFVPGTTDFSSTLAKMRATSPDALFLIPGSPAVADRLTNDFSKLNWEVPLIGGDIYSGNTEVLSKHAQVLEGMVIAEQKTGPDTPEYIEFKEEYKRRFGKGLIYESRAQAQYDLFFILKKGIEEQGVDPVKLSTWIRTVKNFPGFSGGITIDTSGDAIGGHTVKVIRNGKVELLSK